MRAHTEGKHEMGRRFAIVIGVAAACALIAAGASADSSSVNDPRDDAKCYHDGGPKPCSDSVKRNADVVRATAGHEGGRLKHRIRVVGKIHEGALLINTDSDPGCEWTFGASRGGKGSSKIRACSGNTEPRSTGRARYDFHLHSVEIFFSKRSIGNPLLYGWWARAFAGPLKGHAIDDVPTGDPLSPWPLDGIYIPHRLR
jgi:hypothetical protein